MASFTKIGGILPSKSYRVPGMSAAPALAMTQRDGQMAVATALQAAVGYGKRAARLVAEAANCNERTALAWVNGESTPDFIHTMRLIASIPQFAAECRRLTGMHNDLDPEFDRDFAQLITRYQRLKAQQ